MAVDKKEKQTTAAERRLLHGTNVLVTVVLVVGIVAVLQAFAYEASPRWDMTSGGVNSLSDGTEHLIEGLDANIRLTSLYFETDREDEDQPRYRRATQNLIDLYEATNRGKVTTEWINPLKDQEKMQKLKTRLREKKKFKEGIDAYVTRIDAYRNDIDGQMKELVKSELDRLASMTGGLGGGAGKAVTQVENLFQQLTPELESSRDDIDMAVGGSDPQYGIAVNDLKTVYRKFSKWLKDVASYGTQEAARDPNMPGNEADFLRQAGSRYASVVAAIEGETTALEELKPLALDDIMRELAPTTNALLVETDDDARVVDFSSVWPPLPQAGGAQASFKNRAFKGEEKLTAAILRVTHKEQTAVVFVRYGGPPLFAGGFMPGMPAAPYAAMKQQLEDANFIVEEWDLKTTDTPPKIDPAPTRTIHVVLIPTPPQQGQFGQPSQDPPFTDVHKQRVIDALGENPRALFIAGWMPGPFGAMPASYAYNSYLKDNWGIEVDTSALLIQTNSLEPGKYVVMRRDFFSMNDLSLTDHDIVRSIRTTPIALPWCAPLKQADSLPEGVKIMPLVEAPAQDGLWGIKDISKYEDQMRERQFMTKVPTDLEGPFELAVAAEKGDGKIVVVSARDFATDNVAFARELAMTAQGFTMRTRNPGNVLLVVNSLHWLNDNTGFMDIGRPINASVLEVQPSTVKFVQFLTIFVWPVLAICGGGVAWWIRRR